MTDDQHGEGVPQGGGRWDPLPQGEYDDGATAFVKLPEGGIDALMAASDSPLAAPGHGYVPPPIAVTPAPPAATDPSATGTWTNLAATPPDGTQWQSLDTGHQGGVQHPGDPRGGDPRGVGAHGGGPSGAGPYGGGPQGSGPQGAGSHGGALGDRFSYHPGATGQWNFQEVTAPEASVPAPGHDVTGQWSIPVANGDLPDESGEFTTSTLVEQWGGTPPPTLPGGAAAPWATEGAGQVWAPATDTPARGTPAAGAPHGVPGVSGPAGAPGASAAGAAPAGEGGTVPGGRAAASARDFSDTVALRVAVPPGMAGPSVGAAGPSVEAASPVEVSSPVEAGAPAEVASPVEAPPAAPDVHEAPAAPQGAGEARGVTPDAGEAPGAAEGPTGPVVRAFVASGPTPPPADAQTAVQPAAEAAPDGTDASGVPDASDAFDDANQPEDEDDSGTPDAPGVPAEPAEAPAPSHDDHPVASYVLRVNSADRPVTGAWIGESLLYVLRERLGLAGAKDGCSQGECGACNVQVDGRLVASCLVPAVTAAGSEVRTVEGLATDGQPSDVQRALARCGAVQCGFCVPGMAMTVHDLLEGNPAPTELETRQALCGNLCRCSGYRAVVDAVQEVAAERSAGAAESAEHGGDEPRIPHQAGPGAGGINPSAFDPPRGQGHDRAFGTGTGPGQDGGQA
ncbi:2Fe-2S iron-sulfur cluster-binding protein [Streptomyces sp. NPDC059477]|uniref:2Fe-2S iron-sulfur cluster-binding protein n=1 Tax=Streptomyces sp. NPDC059477 TaxID=3346847 RepID=UPI0036872EF9